MPTCRACITREMSCLQDGKDDTALPFFFLCKKKISSLVFSNVGSGMPIKLQSVDAERAVGMWVGAQEKGPRASLKG